MLDIPHSYLRPDTPARTLPGVYLLFSGVYFYSKLNFLCVFYNGAF